MADNTPIIDANDLTEEIATDELVTYNGTDVSGASPRIKAQRNKIVFGSPTTATDVDSSHPLPVVVETALPAGSNVIGHVDVDALPALPAGTNVIGHVVVDSAPAIAAGANAIGTVGVTSLPTLPAGTNVIGHVDVDTLPALPAGTNVIGHVDVDSLPAISGSVSVSSALPAGTNNIGDVDVLTMPAASRTTDSISAADATDAIMVGLTALTPKFAKISASGLGANTIVAAVASKKIRVLRYSIVAAGAVSVKWQSHVTPTDLTGSMSIAANGGISEAYCPVGLFETVAGEALDINLGSAVAVGGVLTYVEV